MATPDVGSQSNPLPLYRAEATKARQFKVYGEIILIRPVTLTMSLCFAALFLMCSLTYLYIGRYAEKAHLVGTLTPDKGTVTVYSLETAQVKSVYVHPGQHVSAGEAIFALTAERSGAKGDASLEAQAKARMVVRLVDLRRERIALIKTSSNQVGDLTEHNRALQHQRSELQQELLSEHARTELAKQRATMQEEMYKEHLISQAALLDSKTDVFEQEKSIHELQRTYDQISSDIHKLNSDLEIVPLTLRTQLADNDKLIADQETQLAENGYVRDTIVRATIDGIVSTVLCQSGMQIQPTNPLATLLPKYEKLEARLYAPSKSMGFLHVGDEAELQYPSFPYEKFGRFPAKVISISSTPLSPIEYSFRTGLSASEPMYEVQAALPSQEFTAEAQRHQLQPGMAAEADVVLDSRRLIEWILRPFFGMKKSVLS
jgi:membrane fusion protein